MRKDTVLVVDDIEVNREILVEILQEKYNILQAADGFEAVEQVMNHSSELDLILLDIMMPEMDGYEVLDVLRESGYVQKIPVIVITAAGGNEPEIRCLQAGAVDFVNKPFHPDIVRCRVDAHIELKKHRSQLEELVDRNVQKVLRVQGSMVEFLASVIEYRHVESGRHVRRTREMAELLASQAMRTGRLRDELSEADIRMMASAVPLHDIGKISTPDNILLKPGKLTPEEFAIIRQHTTLGAEIIDTMRDIEEPAYIRCCRDICLYHHECWDGNGYPEGLRGKQIPLGARIMSIVDVYDALTNARVYKPALTHAEAVALMRAGAGTQFDPVLSEIFLENHEKYQSLSKQREV